MVFGHLLCNHHTLTKYLFFLYLHVVHTCMCVHMCTHIIHIHVLQYVYIINNMYGCMYEVIITWNILIFFGVAI